MEVDSLKRQLQSRDLETTIDKQSSLNKINIRYNRRDDVPGLNLAKLKDYQEADQVQSQSSDELDRKIEQALDKEIKENPDVVNKFPSVDGLKK